MERVEGGTHDDDKLIVANKVKNMSDRNNNGGRGDEFFFYVQGS